MTNFANWVSNQVGDHVQPPDKIKAASICAGQTRVRNNTWANKLILMSLTASEDGRPVHDVGQTLPVHWSWVGYVFAVWCQKSTLPGQHE